jgi:hypothetical protein
MLEYLVLNEEGDEVKTGSTVTDIFGNKAIFMEVTRGVEYNGVAKVRVAWDTLSPLTSYAAAGEYFASLFGLKVQTMCGVPACGSVDHSTRDHNAEERH